MPRIVVAPLVTYSSESVGRLTRLIGLSLQCEGLQPTRLAERSGISPATAYRYALIPGQATNMKPEAVLKEPRANVLKAIAPHIYRAVRFLSDGAIEFDTDHRYDGEEDWRLLMQIATVEFDVAAFNASHSSSNGHASGAASNGNGRLKKG